MSGISGSSRNAVKCSSINAGTSGINAGAFYNWLVEVSAIILEPDDKRCLSYPPILISPDAITFDVIGGSL
jgi:hypothetical protein